MLHNDTLLIHWHPSENLSSFRRAHPRSLGLGILAILGAGILAGCSGGSATSSEAVYVICDNRPSSVSQTGVASFD